jgi:phosphatidate cytidylyltransferase
MSSELASRLVLGPVLAMLAIGLISIDLAGYGPWGCWALACLVASLGCIEFRRLLLPWAPGLALAPVIACALVLVALARPDLPLPERWGGSPSALLPVGLALVWIALRQMARLGLQDFLPNVAGGIFGVIYVGGATHLLLTLACLGTQANPVRGAQLLIVALTIVKLGDTTAYFGGRLFGRTKLCPSISPGKTRAGFVASLIGNVGGAYLAAAVLTLCCTAGPFTTWWQGLAWGLVLGPVGALGDLVESCVKRSVAVKDSGHSLKGFGGFLDVFDAVLLAAPVAYLLGLVA